MSHSAMEGGQQWTPRWIPAHHATASHVGRQIEKHVDAGETPLKPSTEGQMGPGVYLTSPALDWTPEGPAILSEWPEARDRSARSHALLMGARNTNPNAIAMVSGRVDVNHPDTKLGRGELTTHPDAFKVESVAYPDFRYHDGYNDGEPPARVRRFDK